MQITIPYGNFGAEKRTYNVIAESKGHFLFRDGETLKIANQQGLVVLKNDLNKHLPELSVSTFFDWVDWVCSLPDDMQNRLPGNNDLKGNSPTGNLYMCQTQPQEYETNLPF